MRLIRSEVEVPLIYSTYRGGTAVNIRRLLHARSLMQSALRCQESRGKTASGAELPMLAHTLKLQCLQRSLADRSVVALLSLFMVFSSQAVAGMNSPACPEVLMEAECAQYQQRLHSTSTPAEREQIIRDYQQLVDERRHLCRYPNIQDMEKIQSFILRRGQLAK